MKRIAIVLVFGLFLQIVRLGADSLLDQFNAPNWTYWFTLGLMFLIWFTVGNWLFFRLGQKRSTPRKDKPIDRD